MTRTIFVDLVEASVVSRCLAEKVGISAIETLPEGGTRLVCMSTAGAESMRRKLKKNLITSVERQKRYPPGRPVRMGRY